MTGSADSALQEFRSAVSGPDEEIDLARAALLAAKIEYPDLDVEPILQELNALAAKVLARTSADAEPLVQVEALGAVVFGDLGLCGAVEDYYAPGNSYLNEVFERRTGIPVSLAILYLSVGARASIPLAGTAMPMHFIVRVLGTRPPRFVDCFHRGAVLTEDQCREGLRKMSGGRITLRPSMLEPVSNVQILTRLLMNLRKIHLASRNFTKALPVLDRLRVLNPSSQALLKERGLLRYSQGHGDLARRDLETYLLGDVKPDDARVIRKILRHIH